MPTTIVPMQERSSGQYGSQRRKGTAMRRFPPIVSIGLCCLAFLSSTVNCQGTISDPRNKICLFDNHRTIVVGSTLFVEGGEYATRDNFFFKNNTAHQVMKLQNEYLWKLDLTQSFPAKSPPWQLEYKPTGTNEHYNGAEGTIWNVGMGTLVSVGGWFPLRNPFGEIYGLPYFDENLNFNLPAARMFTYEVATKTWSSVLLSGVERISTASWASSERLRKGYVLGGVIITEKRNDNSGQLPWPTTETWLETLTEYDFTTQKWNTTDLPLEIGKTVDGGLIALDRVGESGVLIFLGGEERSDNGTSSRPEDDIYQLRSMEKMWIYDIASSVWYPQIATGQIPVGRRQSCFFMVPAPDLSSFQIYTFSGARRDGFTFLDLYVLTVPGFIWKQVPLKDYPDNYPMNAHQCSPHAQGRQMLIVPGNINASTTSTFQYLCNNGTSVRIFDTMDWTFRTDFDPSRQKLGVPDAIIDLIGGTTEGGAEVTSPTAGWDNAALEEIFSIRNDPIVYDSQSPNNGSDLPVPPQSERIQKLSGAAIAGICVGAVVGILGFGGVAFCGSCAGCCRKRSKKPHDSESRPVELTAQRDPSEAPGVVPGELAPYSPHHELQAGYLPPELMEMREGKFQYPPKPDEQYVEYNNDSPYNNRGSTGSDTIRELLAGRSMAGTPSPRYQVHDQHPLPQRPPYY